MSELSKDELLRQVEMWLLGCTHDTEIPHEGCKYCPSKKECKQANRQIKEMIQKPGVTEEWIEEKAREIHDGVMGINFKNCDYNCGAMERLRAFIRSLVEEIPLQQLDKNGK